MIGNSVAGDIPQPVVSTKWAVMAILLILISVPVCMYYFNLFCLDGCGPYHNTSSVADLDGDGDLDLVLNNLRHETETIIWAGATLWINQGGGQFTSENPNLGGPSMVAGDVDGDGDADLVQMTNVANLVFNQGGEQGGIPDDFIQGRQIVPQGDSHNWSGQGFVVLGDLNNDGRLDAFISYCCSSVIDSRREGFFLFLPWVWINTPDETDSLKGQAFNLNSIGDLPMRATLGDLDGDIDLDVYAAMLPPKGGDYDSADRVLLNDGSGNFVDSGQRLENARLAGTAASGAVALGDLDGDGDLDALVATKTGAAIWINQGGNQGGQASVFASSGKRVGRGHVEEVFLADLDADGDPDALIGEKSRVSVWLDTVDALGKSQASVWLNDGEAGFRDSGQHLRYTERHGLAVGDFDRDGYFDVFAGMNDTYYHLWLNQGDGRMQEGN